MSAFWIGFLVGVVVGAVAVAAAIFGVLTYAVRAEEDRLSRVPPY